MANVFPGIFVLVFGDVLVDVPFGKQVDRG
jgi:hypothetical protein